MLDAGGKRECPCFTVIASLVPENIQPLHMGFTREWLYKYVHGLPLEFFFREDRSYNLLRRELCFMEPTSKKLRAYQVRLVTDVCRATGEILVEQPTGSGKTVQIVTLVAMHLG